MRRYIRNVFLAVMGKVPIMDSGEKEEFARKIREEEAVKNHDEVARYQTLTENLRERLQSSEEKHREEMRDLHACYRQQVDKLQAELKNANAELGRQLMSKAMFEKTNNTLNDLSAAMLDGDPESILAVSESYEWSSCITRIAQYHLSVLRRKIELENRILAAQDNFNLE